MTSPARHAVRSTAGSVAAALCLLLAPATVAAQQAGTVVSTGQQTQLARADAFWNAGERVAAETAYASVVAMDPQQSRAVYRLAELRRARDLDAAIALYRRYVVLEPRDPWGHLALGRALAARGDVDGAHAAYDSALRLAPRERDVHVARARMLSRARLDAEAVRAYAAWLAISPNDDESRRELARAQQRAAAWLEPATGGTLDSDGTTTRATGVALASPDLGRARMTVSLGTGVAADPIASRSSFDARVGTILRPKPTLNLELTAGARRVDRTFIDTVGVTPSPSPGPGPTPGPGAGGRPSAPIGRVPRRGQRAMETVPTGSARLVWRDGGGRARIDARASRQVLDASPYLVAQGVRRDELGAEADLRVVGALRARAFGRIGSIHNDAESNARRLVGGAIALAPSGLDLSIRAQQLSYGGQTGLAYFAPRLVRGVEFTTYVEREFGAMQVALDAGAGGQQVTDWAGVPSSWSPAMRLWLQLAGRLTPRVSLGGEGEAYDSRVGTDMPSFEVPTGRWRYGSLRVWLRTSL